MDPVTAIALANLGAQVLAMAIDAYRQSGATAEELEALKQKALARLDAAIAGVSAAEPPASQA